MDCNEYFSRKCTTSVMIRWRSQNIHNDIISYHRSVFLHMIFLVLMVFKMYVHRYKMQWRNRVFLQVIWLSHPFCFCIWKNKDTTFLKLSSNSQAVSSSAQHYPWIVIDPPSIDSHIYSSEFFTNFEWVQDWWFCQDQIVLWDWWVTWYHLFIAGIYCIYLIKHIGIFHFIYFLFL